ncbi:DNA-protecting protein DprA, partial [Lactobacillus sp. XV13L]|nr:DNA-protecting protein DprA [Lactobacillus sp. XV13L]
RPFSFPERNRILAGLARSVIVTEAKEKSGSLITANLALQENRNVYAVPGPITSALSAGTNKLIEAGANPITDFEMQLERFDN